MAVLIIRIKHQPFSSDSEKGTRPSVPPEIFECLSCHRVNLALETIADFNKQVNSTSTYAVEHY